MDTKELKKIVNKFCKENVVGKESKKRFIVNLIESMKPKKGVVITITEQKIDFKTEISRNGVNDVQILGFLEIIKANLLKSFIETKRA